MVLVVSTAVLGAESGSRDQVTGRLRLVFIRRSVPSTTESGQNGQLTLKNLRCQYLENEDR